MNRAEDDAESRLEASECESEYDQEEKMNPKEEEQEQADNLNRSENVADIFADNARVNSAKEYEYESECEDSEEDVLEEEERAFEE